MRWPWVVTPGSTLAAINLYDSASLGANTILGIAFDDILNTSADLNDHPLTANGAGVTLDFLHNNFHHGQRNVEGTISGTDGAHATTLTSQVFTIGAMGSHTDNSTIRFENLPLNVPVTVQMFGGHDNWSGTLTVQANNTGPSDIWSSVTSVPTSRSASYVFTSTTDSSGDLEIDLSIASGNYAGVSGVVVTSGTATPRPPALQNPLTLTTQILAPDANYGQLAAAVNLKYSTQAGVAAAGSVNGISFQDIDWLGGTQALAQGGDITIALPGGTERTRAQNTAGTISGPDEAVLESIANTINYLGAGETLTFDLTGLSPNTDARVQLIGGDQGWFGDFQVLVNGDWALWDTVGDSDATTASLLTAFGATDGAGDLEIVVNQVGGNYAGIAGLIVTIPEPSTFGLTALGLLGLLGWGRRTRKKEV